MKAFAAGAAGPGAGEWHEWHEWHESHMETRGDPSRKAPDRGAPDGPPPEGGRRGEVDDSKEPKHGHGTESRPRMTGQILHFSNNRMAFVVAWAIIVARRANAE